MGIMSLANKEGKLFFAGASKALSRAVSRASKRRKPSKSKAGR